MPRAHGGGARNGWGAKGDEGEGEGGRGGGTDIGSSVMRPASIHSKGRCGMVKKGATLGYVHWEMLGYTGRHGETLKALGDTGRHPRAKERGAVDAA
eukprot:365333-Chlamydomonas_euryale.AAC.6